jgi:two-component system response regulator FlrC
MPARPYTGAPQQLARWGPVEAHELNMKEVIHSLVGSTVEEVERELILHTLVYHCGSRTRSAKVLGISIRSIRNKIHEYQELGITVPAPGQSDLTVSI